MCDSQPNPHIASCEECSSARSLLEVGIGQDSKGFEVSHKNAHFFVIYMALSCACPNLDTDLGLEDIILKMKNSAYLILHI